MLKGSLVALVTPFDDHNRVDYAALKRLIDFHVAEGTDGLVIAGTTGESATLATEEHIELIGRAVEISAGRLPIIAGTGSNSTAQTVNLSVAVRDTGLDGYLLVVPYYNKPLQEGMYRHFSAVADAVDKPVILYNVPGRTVADLLPETVARLAKHENIVAIKEATGDIGRLRDIQAIVSPDFRLFSGDDFTVLPFIEQGGHGVVTVSGNVVPAQMAELCRLASAGERDAAKAIDDRLQPLNTALFVESNPIPVKWAVSKMGMIEPHIRLPLTEFSDQYHEQMLSAMSGAGVEIPA
ncbi:MAG: 4-hydroxy-tetrahydrodipicolinate synthase [Gammaproteobacteria bacterium]|nr:4-hydroxy-tetrahydrodipicolinate synthase [Gammaproteobacteria bacterium]MDH3586425.1 4-hydroxy-tetrahydrodipicolinate synthase [Gammaproteobacteria bacterium]MDH3849038.1 4-hydroxy-tetrahydrodipicolinate synthase [Gammaproteobacteria bacterium]MDH3905135.1 4-hydroxy-tetrahydrodipicolinate synthase [Gammaproteobacteria bacterium]NCF59266.1 4-hydroxy-tetrahydrodipicolinate synthase [Gammaproteobacteria bacterium]